MAQRIKDEEIRLKVSIDASSGTKELDELRKSSKLNTMTIAELNRRQNICVQFFQVLSQTQKSFMTIIKLSGALTLGSRN